MIGFNTLHMLIAFKARAFLISIHFSELSQVLSENTLWLGGVSDPQNCKIQKVPGYFLKTKLGIF